MPVTYLLEQTQSDIQKITNFVPETTVTNINFSVKNKPLLLTWKVLGCNRTSTRYVLLQSRARLLSPNI